jgi:hypothetical protein
MPVRATDCSKFAYAILNMRRKYGVIISVRGSMWEALKIADSAKTFRDSLV